MFKNIFTSNGSCGCGKPKPKDIFEPKPKFKAASSTCRTSSSSWERGRGANSGDDDYTSTTYSFNNIDTSTHGSDQNDNQFNVPNSSSRMVSPLPRLRESVAIVKDSEDPYHDFRQSMLQMVLEKEIYSKDDLQELLKCILGLNSPSHHEVIVRAFMDIWNGVVSKRPQASKEA
ncbi:hypothetical protein ACH5RR_009664 [Cinchona calisaya]|uniref:Transcription repressor n=1 Tax=Cinchona calisaya TaxID=153742 RepID=A0ABD3AHW3_9GENT